MSEPSLPAAGDGAAPGDAAPLPGGDPAGLPGATVRHWVFLAVIAALAGLSYAWQLGSDPLEPYYAAAVRSMSQSWHDFAFGAFDPAGTITLDKLPGAFWVQALSVRAFGLHNWSIVLPQAVEGVLTVLVLYRAVQRLAGPTAGLVAALVLAASPAVVALDRGNISDSLMILFLVLAADALSGAVRNGSSWRLAAAGVFVGLAFQAKMIEAWMVLPALGLAYLLAGPGRTGRRLVQLAVAGAAVAVVSLSWMTAVQLVPASQRPYVDGSHDNSTYAQVFVYNGFGRFGDQTPLQLLAGQSIGHLSFPNPPPAADRLLQGDLGRDTGWLLPGALVVAAGGVVLRRRRPRGDPLRACLVLWGAWLVTLWVVFSAISTINAYYTAALAPPVAGILGAGFAAVLEEQRGSPARRLVLAVVVAGSAGYAAWLLPSGAGRHVPGWLAPLTIAAGIGALALAGASLWRRDGVVFRAALAAGLAVGVLVPAAASAVLVDQHEGAFDTPFEPAGEAAGIDALFVRIPVQVAATIPKLEAVQRGAPYLLAVDSSAVASVFIYASGREALPIGGFDGTIPSPTLQQIETDVRLGRFHLVLAGSNHDPRIAWIAAHCINLPTLSGLRNFYCLPSSAG
ncbi:MAG TPA: glycosyltransferase family 39 protein [Acidimicrobiales bacterium]|nr:glycosyltransferase family 39 protein [Acidimicrobiales bacterium]